MVAPSGKVYQSFKEVYEGMQSLFMAEYKTRGVAKLCPEDTYDELTGIIVASKKAEKTGNKLIRKDINKFIKKLETLTADLKAEVAALEHREKVLSEDKH
jgi:chaperonin cofactor prefoldin